MQVTCGWWGIASVQAPPGRAMQPLGNSVSTQPQVQSFAHFSGSGAQK
jgi:hypothetical protein